MGKRRWEYIYGINPCFEVIRGGLRTIYGAYLSQSSERNPRLQKLHELLIRREIPVEWVEKGRVYDLAQTKDNQGVVMKTSPYPYVPLAEMLEMPRLLLLDHVEDPHNVGAVIRCADVFGFQGVLLPLRGTPDVYPSVVKISAGASEHLKIARETSPNQYLKRAVEAGYKVVALDMKGTHELRSLNIESDEKVLLVIGGEAKAVGQFILNEADYVVRIEQAGKINSLNASVAAGVAMYTLGGGSGA